MAKEGWISPWAFQDDALSADDLGRSAMANKYIIERMLDDGILEKLNLAPALANKIKALEKKIKAMEKVAAQPPAVGTEEGGSDGQ